MSYEAFQSVSGLWDRRNVVRVLQKLPDIVSIRLRSVGPEKSEDGVVSAGDHVVSIRLRSVGPEKCLDFVAQARDAGVSIRLRSVGPEK